MRVGVPKEIKIHEYRVGLTPDAAARLTREGHDVLVETGAGVGAGFEDAEYTAAGAEIVADADSVFGAAEMIVKVKEPQLDECARFSPGQILFTYLHLAADPEQACALMRSGATAIAYETVTDAQGTLPLLKPMSCIAGRMATQVGAHYLEMPTGRGMLLGGVPGVAPARVVVVGAGVAGTNALEMAVGLQADVTVLDIDLARLEELATRFGNRIRTLYSTPEVIAREVRTADLVIGSVLIPGASAPKLVTREMVRSMRPGSVLVDIAIDQGGCFETSRPTSHADPVYVDSGVVHYAVTNMPGAVPRTATLALNNATLPHVLSLARLGWRQAVQRDPHLRDGINVSAGEIKHRAVAEALASADSDDRHCGIETATAA
ncbi:MAG: alanine dehydrogenase [Rhodospirillaceae bacterium]|nr:alanine dehydrogenase [Rhodospirillaceae bacterium]